MLDFRCLADRCEDTCCVGLRVPVSEGQLWQLQAGVKGSPDEERVESLLLPNPEGPPAERAYIRMGSDGSCPFLDTERLCSLHRRHGEKVLPDPCVTFPRIVWKWIEHVEVAGSLACPEMARLLLLEEGALEQVPGPLEQVPRLEAARALPGEPGDAYVVHAELVRAAALRLLHRREFPLASRLMFLGQLAFRLDSVFRSPEPFAGNEAEVEQVVQALLQPFDAPEALEAMHQEFLALEVPGGPCAGLVASMLKSRAVHARGERFGPFVRRVLGSLWGSEQAEGDPQGAWREYAARWERLMATQGARVEQYFLNYGITQWLRAPFTELPSLLAYVFRLVLRVATLRLALAGHPAVAALCAAEQGEAAEEPQAVLDRAAIECFYLVSRHVEQAPDVLALVRQLTGAGGAETLGKALVFSKFC
ncbi:flagellin lysine-N-methylase [Hyalangium sp.]|uniref:flagellin lysine-N-methylase n=1 Tax=Hyalangium sp. TaxID=2028555 RepID=UPI002D42F76E|nr:flagellin lysine-N-methylase [Hyalangium sp.]HYH97826.1 flagellin lysine-N-methylase [Hyalangium sp.]